MLPLTTRKRKQFSLTISGKNIADVINFQTILEPDKSENPIATAQRIDVTWNLLTD